jgi:putative endonuclease
MSGASRGEPFWSTMSTDAQDLGLLGERIAAKWLRARGWTILVHRFRNGHRDIDLVSRRDNTIAFVEVKTRSDLGFGGPVSAVDYDKLQQLRRSALVWMARNGRAEFEYRVDVIGVLIQSEQVKILHVENAYVFHGRG